MSGQHNRTLERTLAHIENQVLEEVWIPPRRIAVFSLLMVLQLVCALTWFGEEGGDMATRVPLIAVSAQAAAAAISALALTVRRFRWCCAAAYCCGLAAVIGVARSGGCGQAHRARLLLGLASPTCRWSCSRSRGWQSS